MSTEKDSKSKGHSTLGKIFRLFGWTAIVLFAYLLSTGPVGRIPSIRGNVFGTVYLPLIAVSHHSPALDDFLGWYVSDVWRVKHSVYKPS